MQDHDSNQVPDERGARASLNEGKRRLREKILRKRFFCSVCDASCGLVALVHGNRVIKILPDKHHPVSRGYCCPKGLHLHDLTNDPDRIRRPMHYRDGKWREMTWKSALSGAGRRLRKIIDEHGPHAVATHMGTNGGHCFSHSMFWKGFCDALGTRNVFNAGSVDNNNKFVAQNFMYGNSTIMPIPDLRRSDFLLLVGTNPASTNLSLAKCPNVMLHVKQIAKRGKVVLVDPRRNETAKQLGAGNGGNFKHHFIVPGTDTFLFLAMLDVIIKEGLLDDEFIARNTTGWEKLLGILEKSPFPVTPVAAGRWTGIPAADIEKIARDFATTSRAAIYARLGTSLSLFPTLNAWLVEVLHAITGHLDREGCAIFGHAPFKVARLGKIVGLGLFDEFRSRIGGFPSVMGALPLGILAREMSVPGKDSVRAFIECGGNVARTAPASNEIVKAMENLDLAIHVDFYLNETAHATAEIAKVPENFFFPATTPLEKENVHLTHLNYNVIPHVEYNLPVVRPDPRGPRDEWEILLALTRVAGLVPFGKPAFGLLASFLRLVRRPLSPGILVSLLSLIGNVVEGHPPILSTNALTLGVLKRRRLLVWKEHRYGVIREHLLTRDRKVHLWDERLRPEIERLKEYLLKEPTPTILPDDPREIILIGRRHVKTMNSWMHNLPSLWKQGVEVGAPGVYPSLLLNPADAGRLGLKDGDLVRLVNENGHVVVPVSITPDIMERVACYPHGWGHDVPTLSHARKNPGVNINVLTSSRNLERLSGIPRLNWTIARVEKFVRSLH